MSRRLLVLEPYFGGSHRSVLECLLPKLDWEHDLLTLPARKWKWRMRGSGITMARQVREMAEEWRERFPDGEPGREGSLSRWDLVYASTFLNLPEFLGLVRDFLDDVPALVYFHENQLLYPSRFEAGWDLQFPLTNVTSALAADGCLFNTRWNLDGFLAEIPGFLKRFPDHLPKGVPDAIASKSQVLPPPFDPAPFDAHPPLRGERPRIVWPHRWEHDKTPEAFFSAMSELAEDGLDFEVAVAGQAFAERPAVFERAAGKMGGRLVHIGEPEDKDAYARLLASSDIAVSTANNEFFGLAMVEAAYAGCYPLVPDKLCYPEIYGRQHRYKGGRDLVARLSALIADRPRPGMAREVGERYVVGKLLPAYESAMEATRLSRGTRTAR